MVPLRCIAGARSTPRPLFFGLSRRRVVATAALVVGLLGGATPALADQWVVQPAMYEVQPGDSVESIATQYGVSVADLVTANPTVDPGDLAVGQTLAIGTSDPHPSSADPALTTDWPGIRWQMAHFPSFAIAPDGVVRRILSPLPANFPISAIIPAPYHSQFDGSTFAEADCGPTALSMALGALGIDASQRRLRALADLQMHDDSADNGTTWESLAYAAQQYGASARGWARGNTYRHWTLDNLRAELAQAHPVLILVRYWDLPDHRDSSYGGDHYVVALGIDARGDLIYHDPAVRGNGAYRFMTADQLLLAWGDTEEGPDFARTAMALSR